MKQIFTRRSIRKYKEKKVSEEVVQDLLKAAMAAPSAGNEQPWEFIVIRDKNTMKKITEFHQYSKMLLNTDVAIVVCGDIKREKFKGYWVQDCSAAIQNILLEAEDRGLGAVWLGVYPMEDRVEAMEKLLGLPEGVITLGIVPVGYPDEYKEPADRFDESRIHYEKW